MKTFRRRAPSQGEKFGARTQSRLERFGSAECDKPIWIFDIRNKYGSVEGGALVPPQRGTVPKVTPRSN